MARFEYVNDTIQELYVQTYTANNSTPREVKVLRQTTSPVVAAGNWTATAVTLGFSGLVGTLPPAGVFLCGTEKIQYGSITWTTTAAGTFNLCKRGWEGTTAATHNNPAPIYFGDAFAWLAVNLPLATETTIPFTALDRPGITAMGQGQIPETGIIYIGDEWIWYGGVTYTNNTKTVGNLLYCFRGYNGTTAVAHDGSVNALPIRFEHVFTDRENFAIYNYASSTGDYLFYGFNPTIRNAGTNALPIVYGESVTIPLGGRNRVYVIIESTGSATGPVAIAEWR